MDIAKYFTFDVVILDFSGMCADRVDMFSSGHQHTTGGRECVSLPQLPAVLPALPEEHELLGSKTEDQRFP